MIRRIVESFRDVGADTVTEAREGMRRLREKHPDRRYPTYVRTLDLPDPPRTTSRYLIVERRVEVEP